MNQPVKIIVVIVLILLIIYLLFGPRGEAFNGGLYSETLSNRIKQGGMYLQAEAQAYLNKYNKSEVEDIAIKIQERARYLGAEARNYFMNRPEHFDPETEMYPMPLPETEMHPLFAIVYAGILDVHNPTCE